MPGTILRAVGAILSSKSTDKEVLAGVAIKGLGHLPSDAEKNAISEAIDAIRDVPDPVLKRETDLLPQMRILPIH